jgi:hypothetical protein
MQNGDLASRKQLVSLPESGAAPRIPDPQASNVPQVCALRYGLGHELGEHVLQAGHSRLLEYSILILPQVAYFDVAIRGI